MTPAATKAMHLLVPGPRFSGTRCNAFVKSDPVAACSLSASQVARRLGVSLGTIRRWSDLGYLESHRTSAGQRRFRAEQVDGFVDSLQRGDEVPLRNVS